MTRLQVIDLSRLLAPTLTTLGIAITLGSLRRVRLVGRENLTRLKHLWRKLTGQSMPTIIQAEPVVVSVRMGATTVDTGWNDDWSNERKFAELINRIDLVRAAVANHEHDDLTRQLSELDSADQRLADTLNKELEDRDAEERLSEKWAFTGLVTTGVGAVMSILLATLT